MQIIRVVNGSLVSEEDLRQMEIHNEALRSIFAGALGRELRKGDALIVMENVPSSLWDDTLL